MNGAPLNGPLKMPYCNSCFKAHVVNFVVKLLSRLAPSNFVGFGSHLIAYMSMLNSTILVLSSFDTVHILSLYGMVWEIYIIVLLWLFSFPSSHFTVYLCSMCSNRVPKVAASLMPICEAFGSLVPTSSHQSSMNDETSVYAVFSCAFLFLLCLWKFYRLPYEHCIVGRGGSTWSVLTLEYLLLLRNSRVPLYSSSDPSDSPDPLDRSYSQPVYIESFPKLQPWYSQNQACITSPLSGLYSGNPVHQVANKISCMIYWKITKCGTKSSNISTTSSGSVCGSLVNADELDQRPILPAWEVLEAIPFVNEAVLTACAHGRLSFLDLTTDYEIEQHV